MESLLSQSCMPGQPRSSGYQQRLEISPWSENTLFNVTFKHLKTMTNTIINDASAAINRYLENEDICATKWDDENEKWEMKEMKMKWNLLMTAVSATPCLNTETLVPYTQWHNTWHKRCTFDMIYINKFNRYNRTLAHYLFS